MAAPYPTSQESKTLLESIEIQKYEEKVAEAIGLKLLPHSLETVSTSQRQLYLANLTVEGAKNILRTEIENLILFSVRIHREFNSNGVNEEFPAGEEQEPSEVIEVLGLSRGIGVTHICFYHLSGQKNSSELLTFLQRIRMPNRQKFCSRLRAIFREIQS